MKILHVVKTTHGAQWAAWQASELIKAGIELHCILPDRDGPCYQDWANSGATIHIAQLDFPVSTPWKLPALYGTVRKLVDKINPDLIHSHFVGTTLTLRYALGRQHAIPRIFQIPGPLHLEHTLYRRMELSSAGAGDFWIGSSRCINRLLADGGICSSRTFLSYYGWPVSKYVPGRTKSLRNSLRIPDHKLVIGNISWFYKPKYHLGQTVGLKCHEDVIDALAIVLRERPDAVGLLIGAGFSGARSYERRLRARAFASAGDRIIMPGQLSTAAVQSGWADFDCAVHVPLSENCGGVLEPLCAGVPTIASSVGGLPEVIVDGVTGRLVPVRSPSVLAEAILEVLSNCHRFQHMAASGRALVTKMFDVTRTSTEVHAIYNHLLHGWPRPTAFDSTTELNQIVDVEGCAA